MQSAVRGHPQGTLLPKALSAASKVRRPPFVAMYLKLSLDKGIWRLQCECYGLRAVGDSTSLIVRLHYPDALFFR
jgi:hypothetical protein